MLGPLPEPVGHRDGAFGLLTRDDRVLLVKNPRVVGGRRESLWDLPGGAARSGESIGDALVREWMEETGTRARVGALLLVVDGAKRRGEGAPPLYTWRAFVFRVEAEGDPVPGDGIEAVGWVPKAEAAGRLSAPYHAPLRRYLEAGAGGYAEVEWLDPSPDGAGAGSGDGLRRLLALAAAAAAGHAGLVRREAAAAVEDGTPVRRIEETLLQVVPYAGFPRTIAAFTAARPALGDHVPPSAEPPPLTTGPETFGAVYGDTAERVRRGLVALHPDLAGWTQAFAYGRVLARPLLSLAERELLAVSILTALGRLEDPLLGHMRAAIRLGATAEDVAAAIHAVPHALGEAKRDAAKALLERLGRGPGA